MAKTGASSARVLFDELDLSGYVNQYTFTINQETIKVRGLNQLAPERVVDGYDWSLNYGAFGDFDAGAIDAVVVHGTGPHYTALIPYGFTAANLVYFGQAELNSKPITGQTGSAIGLVVDLSGDEGLSRGVLLDTRSVTGTVNATGQNLGATSAGDTFVVQLHVTADDFSDLDIEIQESSDNGSGDAYAAISGFTQSNISAVGVYQFTTTSATEAWKRVAVTGFTGTSGTIHVVAGTMTT